MSTATAVSAVQVKSVHDVSIVGASAGIGGGDPSSLGAYAADSNTGMMLYE